MYDKDFLRQLDAVKNKEVFAKIILLNQQEESLESIEGSITQGNINIDGSSRVRRTCSLNITTKELNIHEYYWGLKSKFKLSIGVKNTIDDKYPSIIWFNQGVFVISSFNTSQSINSYSISIQGKDKMVLLNGEMGGTITSLTHNFGEYDYTDNYGNISTEKNLLKDIIIDSVHEFAKEPIHNIIVNDLEDKGLELLEYRNKEPSYILIDENTKEPTNITLSGKQQYTLADGSNILLENIPVYNPLFNLENEGELVTPTVFYDINGNAYTVAKLEYGQTAGYKLTDLVYSGDLISNVGESIVSMLDKIINMLGEYEYFYDINGRFIFRRKKTYINTTFNNIVNNLEEEYVESVAYTSSISYSFENSTLISSFTNAPDYANLKNDYSIWGVRNSSSGSQLPVHMRFAIDQRPKFYVDYNRNYCYSTDIIDVSEDNLKDKYGFDKVYEDTLLDISSLQECVIPASQDTDYPVMAIELSNGIQRLLDIDTYGINIMPNEYVRVGNDIYKAVGIIRQNYLSGEIKDWIQFVHIYPSSEIIGAGKLQAKMNKVVDWREIIYQMALDFRKYNRKDDFYVRLAENNNNEYPNGITGYEHYYTDMEGFWRQLYNPDYEFSYKNVYLTKQQYLDSPDKYYYSIPKYTLCEPTEKYRNGIDYYAYEQNEIAGTKVMTKVNINRSQYNSGVINGVYYYINPKDSYEIVNCVIIEPYRSIDQTYYDINHNIITGVLQTQYELNPENYYFIYKYNKIACFKREPFVNGRIYYYRDTNAPADISVTQEVYDLNAHNLYWKEKKYRQCTETEPFDIAKIYYTKEVSGLIYYQRVSNLTQSEYEENRTQYYIDTGEDEIFNCIQVIGNYNNNDRYSDEKGNIITIVNEEQYQEQAILGKLFRLEGEFMCCKHPAEYSSSIHFYEKVADEYSKENGWKPEVYTTPELLNFWFDFLDDDSELQKFSCHTIGTRQKAVNDTNVKSIYFRETPTIIFVNSDKWEVEKNNKLGYTYVKIPQHLENIFSVSGQGKSAKDVLDNYLYSNSCCAESITLSTIPIYYLEPNTRIYVKDDNSGINGEYIVSRYSLTLGNNNSMSISATKAINKLY